MEAAGVSTGTPPKLALRGAQAANSRSRYNKIHKILFFIN
jgi:hypothetical protein